LTQLGHAELAAGRIEAARILFTEGAEVFQAIGNPLYLTWCLEGLAGIAVADQRWELAAQEPELADAVAEIHDQVSDLLGHPRPGSGVR
jgi:hypothetical protein